MSNRLDLVFDDETINNETTDDYYTPPFIFEALGLHFDLDVSGPAGGVCLGCQPKKPLM